MQYGTAFIPRFFPESFALESIVILRSSRRAGIRRNPKPSDKVRVTEHINNQDISDTVVMKTCIKVWSENCNYGKDEIRFGNADQLKLF